MNDYPVINAGTLDALDSEDESRRTSERKSSGTHSSEWLVNVADDIVVPMVTSEVVEALRAGRLDSSSLVWRIGMHDWSALAEVPQLRLAAGSSALPPSPSTPGPIVLAVPAEPRRRTTLPMGLPIVREPNALEHSGLSADLAAITPSAGSPILNDSETPAVDEGSISSLAFSDFAHDDWQSAGGRTISANGDSTAPVPPGHRRLTPVPPVPARLPARQVGLAPTNRLAPRGAEAEASASIGSPSPWGDRSVVFASELRAVKKTSNRLVLWAAIGSAVIASVCTFSFAHSPAPPAVPTLAQPAAAAPHQVAAVDTAALAAPTELPPPPASAVSSAAALAAATARASAAAEVPAAKPKVAAQHVKHAKPALPLAVDTPTTDASAQASDSTSEPKLAAPLSGAPLATPPAMGSALTAPPEAPRPVTAPAAAQ